VLDRHFNDRTTGFFTTVAFECEVDAALSWTLPADEAQRIARAFDRGGNQLPPWIRTRVGALKKWFGNGGR
jgi:hypothetical protein